MDRDGALRPLNPLLQNIGDGTFHHSGSLAVRAAVAAGANATTYKVLYNSAVAMTGGQHAEGALGVGDLTRSLLAEGVARIIVTTGEPKRYRRGDLPRGVQCWHRDRLEEAQLALADTPGVTVLIHDQECAAELRRKRKRGNAIQPRQRVMINERVCEGCGDCGVKSNCLSVHPVDTELGRKTQIDQSSCNFDFSCLKGDCPAFMTIIPDDSAQAKLDVAPLGADDLPEPVEISTMPHTTRITGIGGTGVVTISQILATAATMAGRFVRSLDQTGLAQKGGAVVSDIKIAEQSITEANRAGEGECDLYLGCDLLVAADSRCLRSAHPGHTVAVISTSAVPTGGMVTDTGTTFPAIGEATTPILDATQAEEAVFLDARALATMLLGQDQFANMLLLGAAYQAGRLPIRAEHIEEAIRQGQVKVEENRRRFGVAAKPLRHRPSWNRHWPVCGRRPRDGSRRAGLAISQRWCGRRRIPRWPNRSRCASRISLRTRIFLTRDGTQSSSRWFVLPKPPAFPGMKASHWLSPGIYTS